VHVRAGRVAHPMAATRDSRCSARGARMEAITGALGSSLQVAFDRWQEWAVRQRDFIVGGKPGITEDEYEAVARRFAAVGIK
jgi:hypothetical protein